MQPRKSTNNGGESARLNLWQRARLQTKLLAAFAVICVLIGAINTFVYRVLISEQESVRWVDHTNRVLDVSSQALAALVDMETGFRGYMVSGDSDFLEPYEAGKIAYAEKLASLKELTADNPPQVARWDAILDQAQKWQTEWTEPGMDLRAQVTAGEADMQSVVDYVATQGGKTFMDAIRVQISEAQTIEETLLNERRQEQSDQMQSTQQILVWGTAFAIILGLGIAYLLARSIAQSAQKVTETAKKITEVDLNNLVNFANAMAQGDLTQSIVVQTEQVPVTSQDEMGDLARAFNTVIGQLQETGVVFSETSKSLQHLLIQVMNGAQDITRASGQLNDAAEQSGNATQQIAQTIGHVAEGNGQLSQSVGKTRDIVEKQSQFIDSIATGARNQASAVDQANRTLTQRLSTAIQQVKQASNKSNQVAEETGQATESGATAVTRTIQGMQAIAQANGQVGRQVTAMGQRSQEIGAIVSTIDEIAERTNLLALNAAIEAARAGEHGKGFAVVADEVRKLAEQSTRSTKEIASLIQTVQQTVDQAIKAMDQSNLQVETGLATASETEQALSQIRASVKQVTQHMQQLSDAVVEMSNGSQEMESIMDEVAIIVETNSSAAEELAGSSERVLVAMTEVSAVSEQSSAAAEEVSASAEEVSAQVEQTVASAESLAQTALQLEKLVSRFKVENDRNTNMEGAVETSVSASRSFNGNEPNGQAMTFQKHAPMQTATVNGRGIHSN